MSPAVWGVVLSIAVFAGCLACMEAGFRFGRRRGREGEGTGPVDGAIFGLLGLLLAFSFAGATSRLDHRRQLITNEANAIGTALLRIDLLPADAQPEMRRMFREYVDARIRMQEQLFDPGAAEREMARATALQQALWTRAVAASRAAAGPDASLLLLPALNEMIDITTSRRVALYIHIPVLIQVLLVLVSLLSALLAGHAMAGGRRSRLHMVAYALVLAVTLYVVVDLDHPRSGLIRLDAADQALRSLRDSIR